MVRDSIPEMSLAVTSSTFRFCSFSCEAIHYPSVQMKYRGANFATFPQVVDSAMQCIDACAMRFCCLGCGRFIFEGIALRSFSNMGRPVRVLSQDTQDRTEFFSKHSGMDTYAFSEIWNTPNPKDISVGVSEENESGPEKGSAWMVFNRALAARSGIFGLEVMTSSRARKRSTNKLLGFPLFCWAVCRGKKLLKPLFSLGFPTQRPG